jgi:hypothetical protein
MIHPIIIESSFRGRRLDPSQSRPRSLDIVGDDNRPVLEWILHALGRIAADKPLYVGGYHIEKIIESFPDLSVRYHQQRDREGELGALCACKPGAGPLLLVSAGTVVLPGAFEKMNTAPMTRGVYGRGRSAGIFYVDTEHVSHALDGARTLLRTNLRATIDDLFDRLGIVTPIDLDGLAAPIVDQEAVARTIFRGKAQTLENFSPLVRKTRLLPRERFFLSEWRSGPKTVLHRIMTVFPDQILVVRSSASSEDGLHASGAGKFRTVLDVPGNDRAALRDAIEAVIASYRIDGREAHAEDEVLVQPQLMNVQASGVLLTRDPRSGGPYFVINEDRASGRSDVVTAGSEGVINQQFVAWPARESKGLSVDTRRVLDFGSELISVSRLDALDVEYAISSDDVCHLLQVRPLAAARQRGDLADDDVLDLVASAHDFVAERMKPVAGLLGSDTVLGVMPDWNPAEMIGLSPRPLALSLYQMQIGSDAWADARRLIGYRDVRPEPLIVALGGRPYVDVRASLNSFLPADIDDVTGRAWIDACLKRLRAEPALHDKIEFEIALTCLAPDWPIASQRLTDAGIAPGIFAGSLRRLTEDILNGAVEPIEHQLATLDRLAERRERQPNGRKASIHELAHRVAHYLHDCRRLGLVPFSILARYGFVSMSFLRGFLQIGAIDDAQYQAFLRAVPTVAGTIAEDIGGGLPVAELVERYGHLRPNSYEITSQNYASDPERFLRAPARHDPVCATEPPAEVLRGSKRAIEQSLADLGLKVSYETLMAFMVDAIAGRERAKFEFMKSLDAALETIAGLGDLLEFDREHLSFLQVDDLLRLSTDSFAHADRAQLRRRVAYNEKRWAATRAIRLPDVIRSADEVMAFRSESWRANFVTRKRIAARPVWLEDVDPRSDLAGAVVVTRAADPGYDWIFAHGIAGLVTEYGGAASHMSIRAAEFGLPAAIGCGAMMMESLRGASMIELDCAAERVRVIA